MSCDSGPEKFQGAEVTFAHFDEEPEPRGDEIFNEVFARISPDHHVDIILTYTPLSGYTWSYRRFWDPTDEEYLRGPDGESIVETFTFTLYDFDKRVGGHLSTEQIKKLEVAFPKHERMARVMGKYSLVSGNPFHDIDQADEARKAAPAGEHKRIWRDSLKQSHVEAGDFAEWLMFAEREPFARYIVGVDIASGSHKDRSSAYCIKLPDEHSGAKLVCRFRSDTLAPDKLATDVAMPMAWYYNRAQIIPEVNGEWGGAFLTALMMVYDNVWNDLKWDRIKQTMTGNIGWRTTGTSRGILLSLITRALDDKLPVFTRTVCDEILTMVIKKDQTVEHAYGMFDDEYFSLALCLWVVYNEPPVIRQKVDEVAETYTYTEEWQRGMM